MKFLIMVAAVFAAVAFVNRPERDPKDEFVRGQLGKPPRSYAQ